MKIDARCVDEPAHLTDRWPQASKDRLTDQEVTDVKFRDFRNSRDSGDRTVIDAVTGVHFKTKRSGLARGRAKRRENSPRLILMPIARGIAISARVQFNDGRASAARSFDLRRIRTDEKRHAASIGAELLNERRDPVMARSHIEPAFCGSFFTTFGH